MSHNGKTFLGIITARGGSKGIPRKNLAMLCGKPLIAYTIDAAKNSILLDRCIVSTDDAELAETAARYGGDIPFLRPRELATDEALALDVLAHAICALAQQGEKYDYVLMLQPTSPLRNATDIDRCIEIATEKNADSVFSLKRLADFAPQKIKTLEDDGRIRPLMMEERGQSMPRQNGPDAYKRNCAVYLTRTDLILKGDQFGETSYGYVMPEERSLDINEPVDLELAEFWMKRHA